MPRIRTLAKRLARLDYRRVAARSWFTLINATLAHSDWTGPAPVPIIPKNVILKVYLFVGAGES
jgi:hypothetical protein